MIEESYVSFDTAKLLKDAGFEANLKTMYVEEEKDEWAFWDSGAKRSDYNYFDDTIACPTQALAARWLREAHGIHVVITEEAYTNGINYLWQVLIYSPLSVDCWDNKSTGMYGDNGEYKTYEGALEAGLREAIKLIKK